MKRVVLVLSFLSACSSVAFGNTVLNDWCVNVGGNINYCNGGSGTTPGGINGGGFNSTVGEPTPGYNNTLGQIVITLNPGTAQFVDVYMDYDLNYDAVGSYEDTGKTVGTRGTGVSYELGDPSSSNIFNDFAANSLANSNSVGTASGPPNQCCDVSWALGVGGLNVAANHTGVLTFTVSTGAPASGYYLEQTNEASKQSIFLSETFTTNGGGTNPAPEPSTLLFGLPALAAVLFFKSRRKIQVD